VRLVEHLAHGDEAKVGGILRVLGDGQPVGNEQLREVHLDRGLDGRGVRLDHPLALDGDSERAGEIRRGDHALGAYQRQVLRSAAQVWRAGGPFVAANAVHLVARSGRRCGHTEHGQRYKEQGRARVPGRGCLAVFTTGDHHHAAAAVSAGTGITATANRLCRRSGRNAVPVSFESSTKYNDGCQSGRCRRPARFRRERRTLNTTVSAAAAVAAISRFLRTNALILLS